MENLKYRNGTELEVKTIFGDYFGLPTCIFKATTPATMRISELADAIELIGHHNSFVGKDVADTLRKLNDKDLIVNASFGREFSPVLYVHPDAPGDTEEEWDKAYAKVKRELKKTNPIELGVNECGDVRAWWD